jgi:NHS family xanthosine MFS transporter
MVDYNCKLLVWDDEVGRNAVWSCWNDGIASLFMPTTGGLLLIDGLMLKKLYGALHILYGVVLFFIHKWQHTDIYLCNAFGNVFYIPIALSNSISFTIN